MKTTLRVLALAAIACLHAVAQDNPQPPQAPKPVIAASAKLEEVDLEKLLHVQADMNTAEAKHEAAMLPLRMRQNEIITRLCAAIGVPASKTATECKVGGQTDDAPFGEVRWEKPAEPPAAEAKPNTPAADKPASK